MPLENYRDIPIKLGGYREVFIGGFARPEGDIAQVFVELKKKHRVGSVVSLSGNYSEYFEEAGLTPGYYTPGSAFASPTPTEDSSGYSSGHASTDPSLDRDLDMTPAATPTSASGISPEISASYIDHTSVDFDDAGEDEVGVPDYFYQPFEETARIEPSVYDTVYEAVVRANDARLKIAIHCGAGYGRTGTALASLKLRELLEDAYDPSEINFDALQECSETVHVSTGAPRGSETEDSWVDVTPLVHEAIRFVRLFDHHDGEHAQSSVESVNDVASLLLYEVHLRQQFVYQHAAETFDEQDLAEEIHDTNPVEDVAPQATAKNKAFNDLVKEVRDDVSKIKIYKSKEERSVKLESLKLKIKQLNNVKSPLLLKCIDEIAKMSEQVSSGKLVKFEHELLAALTAEKKLTESKFHALKSVCEELRQLEEETKQQVKPG